MNKLISVSKDVLSGIKNEFNHIRVKAVDSLGFLTYRCTSKCKTCNIWQRNGGGESKNELSKEEWINILSKLKRYGIKSFEIFGGDAFLRKDAIFDIIKFCSQNKIETYLPTNANLCDPETIKMMIDSCLDNIYLSIDGVEEEHDSIRGVEGTFKRIKKTLDTIIEEKVKRGIDYPKIHIVTTLSNLNYNKFENLVRYFENYPIDTIYPRNLVEFSKNNIENSKIDGYMPDPYYTPFESTSHLFNMDELREFKQSIKEIKKSKSKLFINFAGIDMLKDDAFTKGICDYKKCHVATMFLTINPNGDVVPCPFYNSYVIGNLLKNDLEDIWGNEKHRRFIKLQQAKQIQICQNCNLPIYHPSLSDTLKHYYLKILESISQ